MSEEAPTSVNPHLDSHDTQQHFPTTCAGANPTRLRPVPRQGQSLCTFSSTSLDSQSQPYDHPAASSSLTIVASHRQRGNPLLSSLKEVRVVFANIVPDYLLGDNTACIFISLTFHRIRPHYLKQRINELTQSPAYRGRILLCLVDLPDYEASLEAVTTLAFRGSVTLFLAWSFAEAGRHLETFKQVQDKPPDMLQTRLEDDPQQRILSVLTTIPSINRVDGVTLMRQFGTFRKLLQVGENHQCSIRLSCLCATLRRVILGYAGGAFAVSRNWRQKSETPLEHFSWQDLNAFAVSFMTCDREAAHSECC